MTPQPIVPQPGQESVWNYPRPPRVELVTKEVLVIFNGETIAQSSNSKRVLETSHPPVYYIPIGDITQVYLQPESRTSFCEWKGMGHYYSLVVKEKRSEFCAWYYPNPVPEFALIQNHVAFYAEKMDACYVGGERVVPQPGGFYGGWITAEIVGPFKGEPGSWGW